MRHVAHGVIIAGLALILGRPEPLFAQSKDPAAILAAARQALGGEARLSAVRSFTAAGRTRQVRGDNLVPIEFEIFVELPDKYLRRDEVPAQESGPTASGFNGGDLLQDPPPPAPPVMPGRAGGPPPGAAEAAARARVDTVKLDFARLTLGMFAASFASYPLTFTYFGEAEAPQGKAHVIDCKGANDVTLRLFINQQTHLPIMVSWQGAPAGRGRGPMMLPPGGAGPGAPAGRGGPPSPSPGAGAPAGPPSSTAPAAATPAAGPPAGAAPQGPPSAGAPAGQPPTGAPAAAAPPGGGAAPGTRPVGPGGPPPAPVENRLYFADYRNVDGMQFPFRLRRAVGPDTIEETTFDRFRINQKIDPRRFEPRK